MMMHGYFDRITIHLITLVLGALAYLQGYASRDNRQHNQQGFQVYSFPGQAQRVPAAQAGQQSDRDMSEWGWFQGYSLPTTQPHAYLTHRNVTYNYKLTNSNYIPLTSIIYNSLMEHQKVVVKRPHTFAMESVRRGTAYYDYENNINVHPAEGSNYVCERKIGRGKYSEVFASLNVNNNQKCVIKMLKPIKFKKINREVKILMALAGKHNTVKLLDIVKESEVYCLVFEYINQTEFRTILETIQPKDCKLYIYQILKGLHYAHSMGIMHRDIKPQNVIIDHQKKELKIIDWGLGEFYLPEKDYNVRVSSRYYKGPQLLVSYEYYHYSLDIWSLGVMMAGMIFKKQVFFKGNDNYDQLQQITKTLGTEELFQYLNKYNIQLEVALERVLGSHKSVKLTSFINSSNSHLATPDALDILGKMMQYDHDLRPTAMQCMKHPYFDEVRQENFQV